MVLAASRPDAVNRFGLTSRHCGEEGETLSPSAFECLHAPSGPGDMTARPSRPVALDYGIGAWESFLPTNPFPIGKPRVKSCIFLAPTHRLAFSSPPLLHDDHMAAGSRAVGVLGKCPQQRPIQGRGQGRGPVMFPFPGDGNCHHRVHIGAQLVHIPLGRLLIRLIRGGLPLCSRQFRGCWMLTYIYTHTHTHENLDTRPTRRSL